MLAYTLNIGTCGFPVAKKTYFLKLGVVEIQKTFYTPINEALAKKWREEAPPHFEFVLKAPQTLTHEMKSPTYKRYRGPAGEFGKFRVNKDTMNSWSNFVKIAKLLKSNIIIFQSPPSFKEERKNIDNIINFFSAINKDFVYGWEPRGRWRLETIKRICSELGLIHVVDPFKNRSTCGKFHYYRLHGMGGYSYRYNAEELQALLKIVKNGDYIMFNNTSMWDNALELVELYSSRYGSHKNT